MCPDFQMTRDGVSNFVGATSNMMEKCNSWVELREIDSNSRYNELSKEEIEFDMM
jgi:hypothetical protein